LKAKFSYSFASKQGESLQGDRGAAIDAEMVRVNKLPANSSYAIHRMKVLSKLRHLISIKVRFT
jgi:transposase-like protein